MLISQSRGLAAKIMEKLRQKPGAEVKVLVDVGKKMLAKYNQGWWPSDFNFALTEKKKNHF